MKKWNSGRYILLTGICMLVLCMTGCTKKEAEPDFSESEIQSEAEGIDFAWYQEGADHLTGKIAEGFGIDADISWPQRDSYETLICEWGPSISAETVAETLFPAGVSYTIEDMGEGEVEAGKHCYYGISEEIGKIFLLYTPINSIQYDALSDGAAKPDYANLMVLWNEDIPYLMPESLPETLDSDLENYSREQAIADAHDILTELGYSPQEQPMAVYGLPAESLNQMWEDEGEYISEAMRRGKEYEYQEEDGVYYMLWNSMLNDTPLTVQNYSEWRTRFGSTNVLCLCINERGVQYLLANSSLQELERMEAEPIISLQEALQLLPEFYLDSEQSEERTVVRVRFGYLPLAETRSLESSIQTIPCWQMEVCAQRIESGTLLSQYDAIYINAITGEFVQQGDESVSNK